LVVKYRRKVINKDISNKLKEMFIEIGKNYGITFRNDTKIHKESR